MATLTQQRALYQSEETVPGGRSLTIDEARTFVNGIRDTSWWQRTVPQIRYVEVEPRKGPRDCSCGGWDPGRAAGVIEMLPEHLTELFICHELAHVIAAAFYGTSCGHDPRFARFFLSIVRVALGPDRYMELYDAFTRDGIDFA